MNIIAGTKNQLTGLVKKYKISNLDSLKSKIEDLDFEVDVDNSGICPIKNKDLFNLYKRVNKELEDTEAFQGYPEAGLDVDDIFLLLDLVPDRVLPDVLKQKT